MVLTLVVVPATGRLSRGDRARLARSARERHLIGQRACRLDRRRAELAEC